MFCINILTSLFLDRRLAVILLVHALHHHHRVGIVIQIKKVVTTIVTAIERVTEIVTEIVTVTVTVTIETIGTTGTTDVRILVKNPMIVIGIVVKLKQKKCFFKLL